MVISARENSKARRWGNGIPAMRELLFEMRLAERLKLLAVLIRSLMEGGDKLFI